MPVVALAELLDGAALGLRQVRLHPVQKQSRLVQQAFR
jgi:hypothetical protein